MTRLEERPHTSSILEVVDQVDDTLANWTKRYLPPIYIIGKWFADHLSRRGPSAVPGNRGTRIVYGIFAVLIFIFLLYQSLSGLL